MAHLAKILVGSALAVFCYSGATYLGWLLEKRAPIRSLGAAGELIYLPSPQQARLMSLGFTNLVADYYWVKALQYYTDPTLAQYRYKNLADYLELVVGIDPDYEYAYKFAGLAIPYDTGRWRHVNTRRSTSFLERGARRFPGNWQFHFLLGYNYLNFHNEPATAAKHLEMAAKLPKAPTYLAAFAARVYAVGGELDRALEFSEGILRTTSSPEIEAMMRARITDLRVEKELRSIEAAAKAFQQKHARFPADLNELIDAGFARPPPEFSLRADGVAESTIKSERMVLHQDSNHVGFTGE